MNNVMVVCVCAALSTAFFADVKGQRSENDQTVAKSVSKTGIEMSVSIPQKRAAGLPFNLKVTLRNHGKDKITFRTKSKYSDIAIAVLDANGKAVPLTEFGKTHQLGAFKNGSGLEVSLSPGKELEHELNVARLFDLTREGDYTLSVMRRVAGLELKIAEMKFRVVEE
jgi:hypothetical protein